MSTNPWKMDPRFYSLEFAVIMGAGLDNGNFVQLDEVVKILNGLAEENNQ